MSSKGGFSDFFFKGLLPTVYSLGATVVIVGAMFKILHLPFASLLLAAGLTTEAIIFFLSAFEPRPQEWDWDRVYPQLKDGSKRAPTRVGAAASSGAANQMDRMLESAKIGPQLIDNLGRGIRNLAESANRLGTMSNAAVATNEYAQNVKRAAQSLGQMNQAYSNTMGAMNEMEKSSKTANEYHVQMQNVTKNLGALNAVYEMELKDANTHLKSMNKFYTNVGQAMESIAQAGKNSEQFRDELSKLTTNLSALNRIYGSMLTAMKNT